MFDTTREVTRRDGAERVAHSRRGARAGIRAAAVAAVLAAALTACSPAQAGAAAIVGNRRITNSELSAAVQGIKQGNPQLAQGEGLERTVLYFLVMAPYVLPQAQDNGVGVSEDQAKKLLPKSDNPDPGAVRVLQTFLALQGLQQAGKQDALTQVQKDVTAAKPRLNPRYGTFDTKQMAVVDTPPNWLVPSATPTATPGTTP